MATEPDKADKADEPTRGRRRAATDKAEGPPRRTFPFVYVGQTVMWFLDGVVGSPPIPAVVTAVGERGIDLARIHDNGPFESKEAVRYLHEKDVPAAIREESGGWDYTEGDIRLHALNPKLRMWPEQLARGDKTAA